MSDPVLRLPDFELPFELSTDASNYGTGALLYQTNLSAAINQQLHFIGYYSYTFDKVQDNYPTTEKRALAVIMALRYFKSYLEGLTFMLFTDHQTLTHLLNLSQPKGRSARWIAEIQQFEIDVAHLPGQKLSDVSALSRLHIPQTKEIRQRYSVQLWEATEGGQFRDGGLHVPETSVPKVLDFYNNRPDSGVHGDICKI